MMVSTLLLQQATRHTAHSTIHLHLLDNVALIARVLYLWLGRLFLSLFGLIESNPGPAAPSIDFENFILLNGFKVIYQNAARLINITNDKMNSIRANLAGRSGPLLAVFSESWLKPSIDSNLLTIPGLKCSRYDRIPPNRSMGMVLYHSNEVKVVDTHFITDPNYSLLKVTAMYESIKYTLCFIYRPPRGNSSQIFLNTLEEKLHELTDGLRNNFILLGDLNYDLLKPMQPQTRRLIDITEGIGLQQHVTEPTRTALLGNRITSSLIDHIYLLESGLSHVPTFVNDDTLISDHNCIGVALCPNSVTGAKSKHKHHFVFKRDYNKFNEDLLITSLQNANWDTVEREHDLNLKWDKFVTLLHEMVASASPLRKIRTCCVISATKLDDAPWYDAELKRVKRRVNNWFKAFKRSRSNEHFLIYKDELRSYKSLSRRKCREYYKRSLESAPNPREKQRVINKLIGKEKPADKIEYVVDGDIHTTGDKEIADAMNRYFTEVGVVAAAQAAPEVPAVVAFDRPPPEFHFLPPGFLETYKHLSNINANKPAGPDQIPGRVYKVFAGQLMFIIEHIFASCIYRSAIPAAWKIAHVTPVFKKGDRAQISNYRPIAITSVIPKVFERVLYEQLVVHLESNRLLNDTQYGYRAGMSTTHAVADVTETVRGLLDRPNIVVGALFLDLSKAFDCVNHNLLCNMLSLYGLDQFSKNLIRSFLTERTQCVKVNRVLSGPKAVVCGVPQGSLLGPILFDLYINFLSRTVVSHVVQYADDAALIASSESYAGLRDTLTNDMQNVLNFLASLGLCLNVSKTEFLVFGNVPDPRIGLVVGGESIRPANSARYLGVVIDDALSFDEQNRTVLNKLKRANFLIRAIRKHISLRVALTLLHSLVYSYTDYACIAWQKKENSGLAQLLENQHRFCLKSVYEKGWRYPTARIYRLAQQPTLAQRTDMCLCRFVHSVLHGVAPPRFEGFFTVSRIGRGAQFNRLIIPRTNRRTNVILMSIKLRGAQKWNALPARLREIARETEFKRNIKIFLQPDAL
jgi:hypothetical protein